MKLCLERHRMTTDAELELWRRRSTIDHNIIESPTEPALGGEDARNPSERRQIGVCKGVSGGEWCQAGLIDVPRAKAAVGPYFTRWLRVSELRIKAHRRACTSMLQGQMVD